MDYRPSTWCSCDRYYSNIVHNLMSLQYRSMSLFSALATSTVYVMGAMLSCCFIPHVLVIFNLIGPASVSVLRKRVGETAHVYCVCGQSPPHCSSPTPSFPSVENDRTFYKPSDRHSQQHLAFELALSLKLIPVNLQSLQGSFRCETLFLDPVGGASRSARRCPGNTAFFHFPS